MSKDDTRPPKYGGWVESITKYEDLKAGDYVTVVCKVIELEAGVYPGMHLLMPISDDNVTFLACSQAVHEVVKIDLYYGDEKS